MTSAAVDNTSTDKADRQRRDILTEVELSDWLGISLPTLFRHRRNGTGPAFVRLSARRVGYRRGAVEAWLAAKEQPSRSLEPVS